jgi:hypothetical protein
MTQAQAEHLGSILATHIPQLPGVAHLCAGWRDLEGGAMSRYFQASVFRAAMTAILAAGCTRSAGSADEPRPARAPPPAPNRRPPYEGRLPADVATRLYIRGGPPAWAACHRCVGSTGGSLSSIWAILDPGTVYTLPLPDSSRTGGTVSFAHERASRGSCAQALARPIRAVPGDREWA